MSTTTLAVGAHVLTASGGHGRVVDRQVRGIGRTGGATITWLIKFSTGEYLWYTDARAQQLRVLE